MSEPKPSAVLHFVGASRDRGGVLAVVRSLAAVKGVRSLTAVHRGFVQEKRPRLRLWRGAEILPEVINASTLFQAAAVASRLRPALERRHRIFHGHTRAGLLVGLWLAWLGYDRVVVTVHCHGRHRWFYRFAALVLGARLVWLTPAMKRYYDVASGGWQNCLPNFLSESPPEPRAQRRRDAATEGQLKIGGIGSLVRWKRWHLVLQALAQLPPAERARVQFHHIGSSDGSTDAAEYVQELTTFVQQWNLSSHVHWRGEEASSRALLAEVDVLVIPSEREPFGLGVLEAWAAGVPVLASEGGGPAELITSGRDGWLFADDSAAALVKLISELIRSPAPWGLQPKVPTSGPIIEKWQSLYADVAGNRPVV